MFPDSLFDLARQAFLEAGHTLRNERRDFPEWHRGRPRYMLWAINLDLPVVREQLEAASRHLAGFLLDGYVRQPHLTLTLCGFPTDSPAYNDDFGPERLMAQVKALRDVAIQGFRIEIGQAASFTSAPFLCAHDMDGGLSLLREALTGPDAPSPGNAPPYVPHVTVGLYRDSYPTIDVQSRLDALRLPSVICRIEHLSLMSYAAPEIGGKLTRLADFDLRSRVLHWHAGTSDLQASSWERSGKGKIALQNPSPLH